jgi:hypothetical protein
MQHQVTKAVGLKHGCEDDKPKDAPEEEKKPEVPAMQKNAKAGNNADVVPEDKAAQDPAPEEKKDD